MCAGRGADAPWPVDRGLGRALISVVTGALWRPSRSIMSWSPAGRTDGSDIRSIRACCSLSPGPRSRAGSGAGSWPWCCRSSPSRSGCGHSYRDSSGPSCAAAERLLGTSVARSVEAAMPVLRSTVTTVAFPEEVANSRHSRRLGMTRMNRGASSSLDIERKLTGLGPARAFKQITPIHHPDESRGGRRI